MGPKASGSRGKPRGGRPSPHCYCWCCRAVAGARGAAQQLLCPRSSVRCARGITGVQGAVSFIPSQPARCTSYSEGLPREGAAQLHGRRSRAGGRPVCQRWPRTPAACLVLGTRCVVRCQWPATLCSCTVAASTSWLWPAPHLMGHGYPCLVVPLEGALCPWPGLLGLGFSPLDSKRKQVQEWMTVAFYGPVRAATAISVAGRRPPDCWALAPGPSVSGGGHGQPGPPWHRCAPSWASSGTGRCRPR